MEASWIHRAFLVLLLLDSLHCGLDDGKLLLIPDDYDYRLSPTIHTGRGTKVEFAFIVDDILRVRMNFKETFLIDPPIGGH